MKKATTIIALVIGFAINSSAAMDTIETPVQSEFAEKLVAVFGGGDKALSKAELVRVLDFLQTNLPEDTRPTTISNRLSRENNFYNAARGELTEERFSIRDRDPQSYVGDFIRKFDGDHSSKIDRFELAVALNEVIGVPKIHTGFSDRKIARK